MNEMIEYMKIHLTSLYQDMNDIEEMYSNDWHYLQGQIFAIEHVLETYNEL